MNKGEKQNGDIIKFLKQKDYEMIDNNLGGGSFGKAVLLKDPFIDELFVAKKYEPQTGVPKEVFYKNFIDEIKILYKLNHKNIVRVYNYYAYDNIHTGFILMEYISGKNIHDAVNNWFFDEQYDFDTLFVQLIDAFQYLEKHNIVHRDIREGNILVGNDGNVKVIDFGLGKTFEKVERTDDSMVDIINRSGLDCLPEEYFDGTYDSKTDMFYLAEMYNRILRITSSMDLFAYQSIIKKMMHYDRNSRYKTFEEVKDAINKKDFFSLEISEKDKKIYQCFSNAIYNKLSCFTSNRSFVSSPLEFSQKVKNIIEKNCFEDYIQNTSDLINTIVTCTYRYYTRGDSVNAETIKEFYNWFCSLNDKSKQLVFDNLVHKISSIQVEIEEELPF